MIVGGGGALNPTLLRMFSERLGCKISRHEDYGVPSFALEAMIEAMVASETYIGHTNHVPSHSGAGSSVFAGLVAPGYHPLPAGRS
jgi:1,6-anhydro-N-acetylmuramate kinase